MMLRKISFLALSGIKDLINVAFSCVKKRCRIVAAISVRNYTKGSLGT